MTRIFLLTVSNQYNAYNLILRLKKFMYTKHNGDNAKLRIFSFIPQRQRIQPNFINHTYNQNEPTNNQNNHINVGFTTNTKFMLLQLWQRKFWSIHIQTSQISTNFVHFIHHQFCTFISSIPKYLYLTCSTISYISSIPTWIRSHIYQIFSPDHICQ